MKRRRSTNSLGGGCLILFGLPFLAFGLFMTGWLGKDVWTAWDARSWEPAEAEILSTHLKRHSDGEGGTTYLAEATFTYVFDGVAYQSSRVGLDDTADNFGSWQQDAYQELEAARREQRPTTCWVDPDDPSRALLFRDIRFATLLFKGLFSVVFTGVGLGMMLGGVFSGIQRKRVRQAREKDPLQVWRALPVWRSDSIADNRRWALPTGIVITLLWNVFSWVLIGGLYTQGDITSEPAWSWLVFLFPAVGLLFLWGAGKGLARHRKWGSPRLHLIDPPLSPGGPLAGSLSFSKRPPRDPLYLAITCGSADRQSENRGDDTLAQSTHALTGGAGRRPDGTWHVPVQVRLPGGPKAPLTTLPDDTGESVSWEAELRERESGKGAVIASFPLPVFRTDARTPSGSPGHQDALGNADDLDPTLPVAEEGAAFERSRITEERSIDGVITTFRPGLGRRPGTFAIPLLFVAFVGGGIAITHTHGRETVLGGIPDREAAVAVARRIEKAIRAATPGRSSCLRGSL